MTCDYGDPDQSTECSQQRSMSADKRLTTRAGRWPRWIQKFVKNTGTLLLLLAVHFITLYQMGNSFMVLELRDVGNKDHGLLRHK